MVKKYKYHVVFQCDKLPNFSPLGRTFVTLDYPLNTSDAITKIEDEIEKIFDSVNVIVINWIELKD